MPKVRTSPEWNLSAVVVGVWFAGVLWGLAVFVKDLVYLSKLRRQSTEVTCDPSVRHLAQAADLPAGVQIRTFPECRMPMTWGIFSPVILLPKDFAEWSQSRLKTVLYHEAIHVGRHDWAWQLLARFTSVMAWFHPVILFAAYRLNQETEKAVDDRLLSSGIEASAYAELLIWFAQFGRQRHRAVLSMADSLSSREFATFSASRNHDRVFQRWRLR